MTTTTPTVDALSILADQVKEWNLRGVSFKLASDKTINAFHHDGVTQEVEQFIFANGELLRLVIDAGDDTLALNRFRFAAYLLENDAMSDDYEPIRVRKLLRERVSLNKELNEINVQRTDIVKQIETINSAIEAEREASK